MKKSIRKRLSRDGILGVLKAFRRSRQSQVSFSESESIPLSTLQYWLRKEREGELAPNRSSEPVAVASRLVPVRIMDGPMARADQPIELELSRGGTLRFPVGMDASLLAQYLKAMGERC